MSVPGGLQVFPFPNAKWGPADKPVLILDGVIHRIRNLQSRVRGRCAYVVGISDKHFAALCDWLDVETLQCYEMRVADLDPIKRMASLRALAIRWNTKVRDLSPIAGLVELRTLILEDTPKANDLAALRPLHALQHLEFSGGMWTPNTAATLEPLADLPQLTDLKLLNLRIRQDGLRPLARCRSLRKLVVSNQFSTADYAFLSVKLPQTECEMFAPYNRIPNPVGDRDVMVTGRRKPFLNSRVDSARLARFEQEFRRLQKTFASEE